MAAGPAYQIRLAEERLYFNGHDDIHDLPEIFHYWSNKYVLPRLKAIGFESSIDFMVDPIQWQCERNPGRPVRCFSLGSGNCDQEIQIALQLRARGHSEFKLECLDLNETMLGRGLASATDHGIADNFLFTSGDFNSWRPTGEYDAVLANQALHHVVELEHLFGAIKEGLKSTGVFIVSDMIGRNGHLRWPEALSVVQELWRKLPPSYRYDRQRKRYQEEFENWDYSKEGFEGIRAQDILPLLNANFHFQRFLAFGNVIDPFVDRGFGHNFDASSEWDRAFIDEVHRRDVEGMKAGVIKPTHMMAILGTENTGPTLFEDPYSPSFCIRPPDAPSVPLLQESSGYVWDEYPQDKGVELQIACARLAEAERRIRDLEKERVELIEETHTRAAWAIDMERHFLERTKWAVQLDQELMALRTSLGRSGHVALRVIEFLRRNLRRPQGRGTSST